MSATCHICLKDSEKYCGTQWDCVLVDTRVDYQRGPTAFDGSYMLTEDKRYKKNWVCS
jgi:hypothetical protein